MIFFPSMVIESSPASIRFGIVPWTESYLRRCASVAGLVRSLIATNSTLATLLLQRRAQNVAPDAAETVDSYANHEYTP